MSFRYWSWLAIKLAAATGLMLALYGIAQRTLFRADSLNQAFSIVQLTVAGTLIGFIALPLLWVGLYFLCLQDQRYRCRVCARRLRMPVDLGSHGGIIIDHPGTEYVCPYGHGKLLVELWVSSAPTRKWTRYGEFWQELYRRWT
jgi:hypothetical protein